MHFANSTSREKITGMQKRAPTLSSRANSKSFMKIRRIEKLLESSFNYGFFVLLSMPPSCKI